MFIIDQYGGTLNPEFRIRMAQEARYFRNKYGASYHDLAGAMLAL